MSKVVVTVEGGAIQWIDVPQGVTVVVKNYDIDDLQEEDGVIKDELGIGYIESTWEAVNK